MRNTAAAECGAGETAQSPGVERPRAGETAQSPGGGRPCAGETAQSPGGERPRAAETVQNLEEKRLGTEEITESFREEMEETVDTAAGEPQEEEDLIEGEDPREDKRRIRREARRKAFVEELISWVKSFVIMFCVALFLTQYIIINAVIPSGSMEDTIMTHDRLIGARFSYWLQRPERGDIVIFHYPVDEKRIYIKRIIGLPGETIRIEEGKIYIDDSEEPLQEGYLKDEWDVMNTDFEFHVPEDCYLMLGDNRNWSEDARYWADNAIEEGLTDSWEEASAYSYVNRKKILGKAVFTYFRKFRWLRHGDWYK